MVAAEEQRTSTNIKSFFPILEWFPNYDKSWIRGDVLAAITVWALLGPEAMAYAGIAGVSPEAGLYAAPLALLAYAIFGTSRHLNVGPSSTVAVLSLLGLLAEAKSPHTAILGKRREQKVYGSLENHPDAETFLGLIIFRFDEQLFFANSPKFRQEIRALVSADPATRRVMIDAESINDIDLTALDMLGELKAEQAREGVALRFAQMKELIRDYLRRAGLDEVFDEECFYASVEPGVEAFLAEQAATENMEQE